MESDEELMAAVARGDEGALGTLVERWTPRIHAHLARSCGDGDDADDLLQETWVRVARGARTWDPRRPVRPWLYGIASNLARDLHRRRQARARATSAAGAEMEPVAEPVELDRREGAALRARVERLPERLREVLLLRYYDDLSEAEMAEALGVPRGTVKSRLHGALRELRRGWGPS